MGAAARPRPLRRAGARAARRRSGWRSRGTGPPSSAAPARRRADVAPDALRRKALVTWEASDLDALALDGAGGPRHLVRAAWQVPRGGGLPLRRVDARGHGARRARSRSTRSGRRFGQLPADAFLAGRRGRRRRRRPRSTVTLAPHGGARVVHRRRRRVPRPPRRRDRGPPRGGRRARRRLRPAGRDRRALDARGAISSTGTSWARGADEVIDVKLQEGGHAVTLARSGAQWHEQTPVDRPVEPEVGRAFLDRLLEVQATSLAPAAGADLAALGLAPPRGDRARRVARWATATDERIELVELGAEQGGVVHVRRVEDGVVATLPAERGGGAPARRPGAAIEEGARPPAGGLPVAARHRAARRAALRAEPRRASGGSSSRKARAWRPTPALLTELAEALAGLSVERWVGAARARAGARPAAPRDRGRRRRRRRARAPSRWPWARPRARARSRG